MPPKHKFSENERVLCYHGPLLYEAKVTKVQVKEKIPNFLVHYAGWSRSWDEWVVEPRILKWNETNLQKQKELQMVHPDKRRPKKRERARREPETGRRKRGRHDIQESSTRDPTPEREVKVEIPEELKKWLADDWDLVTRQKQLVRLPKRQTVGDILEQYASHVTANEPEKGSPGQIQEVCAGVKEYFNAMLGAQLLYKFERPQYADILEVHRDTPMAEIYGVEHLLRLFVRIGPMLSFTVMEGESVSLLLSHMHDFLKYVAANQEMFTVEYDAAPQEYHRRMM
jgi:mortality factor 4-like protein 1